MRRGAWLIVAVIAIAACSPRPSATTKVRTVESISGFTAPPPTRAAEPQPMQVLDAQHLGEFTAIEFGPDDRLATANKDGSVRIWDLDTGAIVSSSQHPHLGAYVLSLRWNGPRIEIAGLNSRTSTIDQLGHVAAEDTPPERTFYASDPKLDQDKNVVSLERDGTRFVFPIPEEFWSIAWSMKFSASRDGHILATSYGRELLIWSEPGSAVRRIPLRGHLRDVAVSPNGHHVAAAYALAPTTLTVRSFPKHELALIDLAKHDPPSVLREAIGSGWTKIACSADGSRLAAIEGWAIKVWTVADRQLAGRVAVKSPLMAGSGGSEFEFYADLTFSPDGHWLLGATLSGRLYVYDARTLRRAHVLGAKINPLEDAILIGDHLATIGRHAISIWSISGARLVEQAVVPDIAGAYRDGDDLMVIRPAYDRISCAENERPVFYDRWRGLAMPQFYGSLIEYHDGKDREAGLRARDDLSRTLTAAFGKPHCQPNFILRDSLVGQPDPVVIRMLDFVNYGMYDPQTRQTTKLENSGSPYLRPTLSSFAIERGRYVFALGERLGHRLYVFDWKTGRRLPQPFGRFDHFNVTLFATDGDRVATVAGDKVEIQTLGSNSRTPYVKLSAAVTAVAFRSPQELLVGLIDGRLVIVRDAKVVAETPSSGGAIRRIHGDPMSARATTISADGSVRIWSLDPLREAVALVEYDDAEWIAYTPRGAYRGSPEVADRIHWTFANAESFRFEQFARLFEKPELVARRAAGADIDIETSPPRPPTVAAKLLSVGSATARIEVQARAASRVDRVAAFLEGRMVASADGGARDGRSILEVPALAIASRVAIAAFDSEGLASNTLFIDVAAQAPRRKIDVWVVAAGVSRYPSLDAASQLRFADTDARSIAAAFGALAGTHRPFVTAHILPVLVNDQVSPTSLHTVLAQLAAMKPDDLAIVFLAGHGIKSSDDGESALLTSTADEHDAIKWADISRAIDQVPGRVLVLLDACHAGHLTRERIIPNADLAGRFVHTSRAGVVVFAASKGRQMSYEDGGRTRSIGIRATQSAMPTGDGHGVFTHAGVRSLVDPATDRDGNGEVDLDELIAAVTDRVETDTQGRQSPWLSRRELFGSFTVLPRP